MRLQRRLYFALPAMFLAIFGAIGSALAEGDPDVIYVPTPQYIVNEMLDAAVTNKDDIVYDLGCGDGRIVITAAKRFGARGIGIDIDPQRIHESQANAVTAGVDDRVKFMEADLFKSDFSQATVVALYLLPELNLRLRPKFFKELKPGARIVSHDFDMGDWTPDFTEQIGDDAYFLWILPADVAGKWKLRLSYSAGQDQEYTLRLIQKFQEVKGQVIFKGEEVASSDFKLKGDKLNFFMSTSIRGSKADMYFKGQVGRDGASMSGTVQVEGGPFSGSRSWTAVRSK